VDKGRPSIKRMQATAKTGCQERPTQSPRILGNKLRVEKKKTDHLGAGIDLHQGGEVRFGGLSSGIPPERKGNRWDKNAARFCIKLHTQELRFEGGSVILGALQQQAEGTRRTASHNLEQAGTAQKRRRQNPLAEERGAKIKRENKKPQSSNRVRALSRGENPPLLGSTRARRESKSKISRGTTSFPRKHNRAAVKIRVIELSKKKQR